MLRKFSVQSINYTTETKEKRKIRRNNLIFCTSSCVQSRVSGGDCGKYFFYTSIVEGLQKQPFRSLRHDERLRVIHNGRPRPCFEVHLTDNKQASGTFVINEGLYDSIPWLCGCDRAKRLFCWPCLLFSSESTDWNTYGYNDFNNVLLAANQHKEMYHHIEALKELKIYGKNKYIDIIMNNEYKLLVNKHNSIVEQNRKILSQLIMIISILGSLGHNWAAIESTDDNHGDAQSSANVNNANYQKLIDILKNYNNDFYMNIKCNKSIINIFSPGLYWDLITSISEVMLVEIKNDVLKTKYVTLMLNEVSNMSTNNHIATVLRYINGDGDVVERFVGFSVIEKERTSNLLLNHVCKIVDEFNLDSKLIAYSYDGALVRIEEHNQLQNKVQDKYKDAKFINGYSNNLKSFGAKNCNFNSVLIQSMSSIDQVRIFFSLMKNVREFFLASGKRMEEFEPTLFASMTPTGLIYNSESHFIQAFYENKAKIENLLMSVLSKPTDWDLDTISSTYSVMTSISKFDFAFFLEIFYLVLPATQKLFEIIQGNILHDLNFINGKIIELRTLLDRLRHDFCSIWRTVYDKFQVTNECMFNRFMVMSDDKNRTEVNNNYYQRYYICENRHTYKIIFYNIIDTIKLNITVRFNDISKLEFLDLLNPVKFPKHRITFPENAWMNLRSNYSTQFDYCSLKNELCVIYNDRGMNRHLNPFKLYNYIKQMDLVAILPEINKLCELVITMPLLNIALNDASQKATALDRMNNYITSQNVYQSNLLQTSNAVLYIESLYLENLRRRLREKFDELVMKTFSNKNHKISLLYKT